jgi:hypothetical protein
VFFFEKIQSNPFDHKFRANNISANFWLPLCSEAAAQLFELEGLCSKHERQYIRS